MSGFEDSVQPPVVFADTVRKAFGGVVAVNDVSLAVGRGEVVGLIGPNGSGKSTLLNLLTGTLLPDRGGVFLDGDDVTDRLPHQRARAGMVRLFQQSRVFPDLTLEENLRVIHGGCDDLTITRLLTRVGLIDRLTDPAGALSYGQQRLLEFTRVLALRPRVVLLDEPTAGVHPKIVESMRQLIARLRTEGVTLVIVEHNIDFVASLSDRLVGLADGTVIVDDRPDVVLAHPELISAYFGDTKHEERSA